MAEPDDTQLDLRTVFVKGVSFDWDNKAFEEALSNIGPLRKCFLLKGAGKNHKGCGFATFALKEDAKRAIDDLDGKSLGGRTIQVEAAQKRAPFSERKEKKRKRSESASGAVTDLDGAAVSAQPGTSLTASARAQNGPATVTQAPAEAAGGKAPEQEAPQRKKPKKAAKAPSEGAGQSPPSAEAERKPKTMSPAASAKQLLVRTIALGNLSPATSPQALAYAQSVTEVESVREPSAEEAKRHMLQQDGCTGDVIFLTYRTVKEAMAAVALLHNHVLKEQEAIDRATKGKAKVKGKAKEASEEGVLLRARQVSGEGVHLKKWRLILRNLPFNVEEGNLRAVLSPAGFVWELTVPRNPDGKARGFAFAGFMCRAHAERAIKVANGQAVGGRTIAVDWAVPKAQFQSASTAETTGKAGDKQPQHPDLDSASETGDEDGMSDADEGNDDEEANLHLDAERKLMHSVLSQFDDGAAATGQEALKHPEEDREEDEDHDVEEDESDDDEEELQNSEGPSKASKGSAKAEKAAALSTQQPRQESVESTVFVRGLPLDTLQYELQDRMSRFGKLKACRLVKDKNTQKLKGTAFVEYERSEDAQRAADACAKARNGSGPAVIVRGVQLDVDLALTQDGARTLASGRVGAPSKDNRNLYLMKEGLIEEGSQAWQAMSAADQTKRKRAAAEAKTKLKSPNFFVSRTRLCLRNLPHQISEKALRDLVVAAVKERASKAEPTVKQVKILRDADKTGEAKAKSAKSKGFAFVELTEHEHALCALRQLNNNPIPFGTERRPVVEFAIENAQALKKRALRQSKVKEGQAGRTAPEEAPDGPEDARLGSPRQQRKRKRDDSQATPKTGAGIKAKQAPKEGRGQRQRRKKREGAGSPGQSAGQQQAITGAQSSQPARRSWASDDNGAAGVDAGQERPPKKMRPALKDAGSPKAGKSKKARKADTEKADRLDSMVAQYKQQLFGGAAGSKTIKSSMQRWFE